LPGAALVVACRLRTDAGFEALRSGIVAPALTIEKERIAEDHPAMDLFELRAAL
jgi:hypothetical protein